MKQPTESEEVEPDGRRQQNLTGPVVMLPLLRKAFTWFLPALLTTSVFALGQVPNWTIYNDHQRGPATAANVSSYSLGINIYTGIPAYGPLTNFATGALIPESGQSGIIITSAGGISGVAGNSGIPNPGTPADLLFNGKVDFTNSLLFFGAAQQAAVSEVRITFTNLNVLNDYSFRGTAKNP